MEEKNLLILCIIYFSKNIFLNHFWVQGLVCLLVDLASKIRSLKKKSFISHIRFVRLV